MQCTFVPGSCYETGGGLCLSSVVSGQQIHVMGSLTLLEGWGGLRQDCGEETDCPVLSPQLCSGDGGLDLPDAFAGQHRGNVNTRACITRGRSSGFYFSVSLGKSLQKCPNVPHFVSQVSGKCLAVRIFTSSQEETHLSAKGVDQGLLGIN